MCSCHLLRTVLLTKCEAQDKKEWAWLKRADFDSEKAKCEKKRKKQLAGGATDVGGREIGERRGSSQSRREGERRYKPVGCEYIIHTVCRVIGYLIYSRV